MVSAPVEPTYANVSGGNGYSKNGRDYDGKLKALVEGFKADTILKDGVVAQVHLYDSEKIMGKLRGLPEYVAEATLNGLTDPRMAASHYKVVLDKWGRRDIDTKKYSESPQMVFYRVALNIADGLKKNDPNVDYDSTVRELFEKMNTRQMFPNTPYMANGGHRLISAQLEERLNGEASPAILNEIRQEANVREQLFACFVLGLYDSKESIFDTLKDAATIQASVGGTGFNFSPLRPANEMIHGTGGTTDGPISFMAMYSGALGRTMNQGGKREGANMFMLDLDHPDILRFIYAKRQDGEIPAANISVAKDHPFMAAYNSEGEGRFYPLRNPHFNPELRQHIPEFYSAEQLRQAQEVSRMNRKAVVSLQLAENGIDVLSPWLPEGLDEEYRVIGKVKDGTVYLDAKKVLRHLSFGAWFNGEPGVINTGHINDHNPTHPKHYEQFLLEQKDPEAQELIRRLMENNTNVPLEQLVKEFVYKKGKDGRYVNLPIGVGEIRATNPCGEKPLLPNEACVLGHVNLEKVLVEDSAEKSGYRVDWDKFKQDTRLMYEILDNAIDQNDFTNRTIEVTQKSNRKIGLGFMGLANMLYKLELSYDSQEGRDFVDDLLDFWEKVSDEASFEKAEKFGEFPNFKYSHHRHGRKKRNAIVRTLAPTGTTGFAAQTTGGMEPEYALAYTRTTVQGTTVEMFNEVLEDKLKKYSFFNGEDTREKLKQVIEGDRTVSTAGGSLQGFTISRQGGEEEVSYRKRQENLDKIKRIFVTTYDIPAKDHLLMEAVVQKHVDDAISKTTNFRNNATVEEVEQAFVLAHELGIKGVTFYRDGTRKDQPLKVKGSKPVEEEKEEVRSLTEIVMKHVARPRPEFVGGGLTEKVSTPYTHSAFVGINWELGPDGEKIAPYESFIEVGKGGSDLKALTEGYARLISLLYKAGVTPELIVDQLNDIGGETQYGIGEQKVRSLPDAIAKGMKGILEKTRRLSGDVGVDGENNHSDNGKNSRNTQSGNLCPKCTRPLIMVEGCEKCIGDKCGWSKC